KYAEQLIKAGKLYVCEETPEEVKVKLTKGIQPFGRRDEPNEVMRKWKRMLTGKYNPGEAVIRVKTNLKGKNPALKEWVAFRISGGKHPKVGNKIKVWPLMNFSVAIDDYDLKMTHIIRGKDHEDNTKKQKMIYDFLGWNYPEYIHLGRINFKGMIISASDIRRGVEEGTYKGYDDERVESLASIRKRGIKPKALLKFFYEIGPTKRDKTVDKKEVYKINTTNNSNY
ncbi:MAG: glutamate--tRNA ligase, partial [uncultured DHVE6 group euryarchaeote]